jgi:hypothetical protein
VAGFWNLPDKLCVTPFVTEPEKMGWDVVAESLVVEATRTGVKHIDVPLIGEGQREIIRALEKWCNRSSCRKLSLLRKPL